MICPPTITHSSFSVFGGLISKCQVGEGALESDPRRHVEVEDEFLERLLDGPVVKIVRTG